MRFLQHAAFLVLIEKGIRTSNYVTKSAAIIEKKPVIGKNRTGGHLTRKR